MKNIIITLSTLFLPLLSSAQVLFFQPTSYDVSYDQEWRVASVTDGLVTNDLTVSYDVMLVIMDLPQDVDAYLFNHYVEGELKETFTYNVKSQAISPKETDMTFTSVEF